ncbi:hypothetical protein GCM10009560_48250 [Nonomuraea longicatena]|uniref:Molecular chaperone DnaJ n=1 Tax=Nonomuraea longicatena TaxID=83682 RepID=A0ABP4APN7_9ACTN
MGRKKGGRRDSCPNCYGRGGISRTVRRRIPKKRTADGKKGRVVTEIWSIDCKLCGGTGRAE